MGADGYKTLTIQGPHQQSRIPGRDRVREKLRELIGKQDLAISPTAFPIRQHRCRWY